MCAEIWKASACKTEKEEDLHHHPETEVQIVKIIFVLVYKICIWTETTSFESNDVKKNFHIVILESV
jgi:hypothetical protein